MTGARPGGHWGSVRPVPGRQTRSRASWNRLDEGRGAGGERWGIGRWEVRTRHREDGDFGLASAIRIGRVRGDGGWQDDPDSTPVRVPAGGLGEVARRDFGKPKGVTNFPKLIGSAGSPAGGSGWIWTDPVGLRFADFLGAPIEWRASQNRADRTMRQDVAGCGIGRFREARSKPPSWKIDHLSRDSGRSDPGKSSVLAWRGGGRFRDGRSLEDGERSAEIENANRPEGSPISAESEPPPTRSPGGGSGSWGTQREGLSLPDPTAAGLPHGRGIGGRSAARFGCGEEANGSQISDWQRGVRTPSGGIRSCQWTPRRGRGRSDQSFPARGRAPRRCRFRVSQTEASAPRIGRPMPGADAQVRSGSDIGRQPMLGACRRRAARHCRARSTGASTVLDHGADRFRSADR